MTFPLFLLLVHMVLTVFSVIVGFATLGGPSVHADVQRAVDATLRSGAELYKSSLSVAALAAAGMGAVALGLGGDEKLVGSALGALAIGLLGSWAAGLWTLRASGRLTELRTRDRLTVTTARVSTAIVALASASGGLVASAGWQLLSRAEPAAWPSVPVLFALAWTLTSLVLLSRSAALSWTAGERLGARAQGLHPGALANLVGRTLAATWLRYALVFGLAGFGQVALFGLAQRHPALELDRITGHFLPLGVLAVLSGGLFARSSEREGPTVPWMRSTLVSLAVYAGGLWALRRFLGDGPLGILVPSIGTLEALSVALVIWVGSSGRARPGRRLVALGVWSVPLGLSVLPLGAVPLPELSPALLLGLVLGPLLGLVPVLALPLFAKDALESAAACDTLVSGRTGPSDEGPGPGQLGPLVPTALLCIAAGLPVFLASDPPTQAPGAPLSLPLLALPLLALGASFGALLVLLLQHGHTTIAETTEQKLAFLTASPETPTSLPLAEAFATTKESVQRGQGWSALLLLLPPFLLLGLLYFGGSRLGPLTDGFLLGIAVTACILSFPRGSDSGAARANQAFILPAALSLVVWTSWLVATVHPAP